MDAIAYSNFRQNLRSYMKQVRDDAAPLIVTAKDPEDTMVVMNQRDYDAMHETMQILSNPKLMEKIRRGDQQFAAGKAKQHELLTDTSHD